MARFVSSTMLANAIVFSLLVSLQVASAFLPADMFRGDVTHLGRAPKDVIVGGGYDPTPEWVVGPLNKETYSASKSSPAVDEDFVFIGTDRGTLAAIERKTGKVVWEHTCRKSDNGIHGTAAIKDGVVYVGSYDGWIYAIERLTGNRIWDAKVGDYIGASVVIYNGTVFTGVEMGEPAGYLVGVDAKTGKEVWRSHKLGSHPHSTPTPDPESERIIIGDNSNRISCFDLKTQKRVWYFDTAKQEENVKAGDVKSTPAIYKGIAYVTSWDHHIYALKVSDGTLVWKYKAEAKSMSSASIDTKRNIVIFGSHDHWVYGLDLDSGKLLWKIKTTGPVYSSATIVEQAGITAIGSKLLAPTFKGWSSSRGFFTASQDDSYILQQPLAPKNNNGTQPPLDSGTLIILDTTSGNVVQTLPLLSGLTGAPIFYGDRLYAFDHLGFLYSFKSVDAAPQTSQTVDIRKIFNSPSSYIVGFLFLFGLILGTQMQSAPYSPSSTKAGKKSEKKSTGTVHRPMAFLKLILFIAFAAFILYGPVSRQVYKTNNKIFTQWKMFTGWGAQVCEVRLFDATNGWTRLNNRDFGIRGTIPNEANLAKKVSHLCASVPPEMDIRMQARCGNTYGWHPVNFGNSNVCKGLSPLSGAPPSHFRDEWNDYDVQLMKIGWGIIGACTTAGFLYLAFVNKSWNIFSSLKYQLWDGTRWASTRYIAIMRIGLAFQLWSRYAYDLHLTNKTLPMYHYEFGLLFHIVTFFMAIGLWAQLSTFIAGVLSLALYYYYGHFLGVEPYTHHHTCLLAFVTFFLGLTPCGRSYSLDRLLALKRGRAVQERGDLWALPLICIQVSVVYFWSSFAKTDWAFMSGERHEEIILSAFKLNSLPDIPYIHEICLLTAIGALGIEYIFAFLLWIPRTRWLLIILGIIFHGILYHAVPVYTFTATMWVILPAFVHPDEIHNLIDKLQGYTPSASEEEKKNK